MFCSAILMLSLRLFSSWHEDLGLDKDCGVLLNAREGQVDVLWAVIRSINILLSRAILAFLSL
jgi:hypothetical protein